MLLERYKSTEVDRRTWLHVPSGTRWSTSSDTHLHIKMISINTLQGYNGMVAEYKLRMTNGNGDFKEISADEKSMFLQVYLNDMYDMHMLVGPHLYRSFSFT